MKAHSPVCAAARCLRARLRCLLHHLGSGQVQRDPHAKRTRGKRHGRRRQRGEDVAPASRREREKAGGDNLEASSRSLVSSSASQNDWPHIEKITKNKPQASLFAEGLHVTQPGSAGLDASPHLVGAASLGLGHKQQDEGPCCEAQNRGHLVGQQTDRLHGHSRSV